MKFRLPGIYAEDGTEWELAVDFSAKQTPAPLPDTPPLVPPPPPPPPPPPVEQPETPVSSPPEPPPAPPVSPPAVAPVPNGWLSVEGNRIMRDGHEWVGQGVNIFDPRQCNACAYQDPDVGEVIRRIDHAYNVWGANFFRFLMESYATADGRAHHLNVLGDPNYANAIQTIAAHVESLPGAVMLISPIQDPSIDSMGRPTDATAVLMAKVVELTGHHSSIMYGACNEPQANWPPTTTQGFGAADGLVRDRMQVVCDAIRAQETVMGVPPHVFVAQGTGAWSRYTRYYIDHPVTGGNVAYECHFYNSMADWVPLVSQPKEHLPLIIGELGPVQGFMTLDECKQAMARAGVEKVPFAAWSFSWSCPPNLLIQTGSNCGIGADIQPSPWGQAVIDALDIA